MKNNNNGGYNVGEKTFNARTLAHDQYEMVSIKQLANIRESNDMNTIASKLHKFATFLLYIYSIRSDMYIASHHLQ